MREAAALPLAVITAWEGLVDRARVRRGQRVLVHGGAGGVGHVAVQLALARGAEVFATGSPGSLPVIEGLGATAIGYATPVAESGHVVSALGWGTHSLAPLSFRGATYSGIFTLLPMWSTSQSGPAYRTR